MNGIRISAIITTHNRIAYLKKALEGLAEQTLPKDSFEILVVDNASTDKTRTVVQEEFSELTNLKYVYEPTLGLSHARNTGWRSARGEYVAFLDDDAIPCPQWLEKIVEAFETVEPRPGCIGGKIEPVWEMERPVWLTDDIALSLTIIDWSTVPTFLNEKQWLAGANIVFPKFLLERFNGFNTSLGRRGTNLISSEEVLLVRKIKQEGYKVYYHPEIAVRHHILASRLNKQWFLKRYYWQGVSDALLHRYLESPTFAGRWILIAKNLVRLLIYAKALVTFLLPTDNPDHFAKRCYSLSALGNIRGLIW